MIEKKEKYKATVTGREGIVATLVVGLSFFLQAEASVYIPPDLLNSFPENTIAVSISGFLFSGISAGRYWFKRRKRSRKG